MELEALPAVSLTAGQTFWCVSDQAILRQDVNPYALYFGDSTVFATGTNNVDYHIDPDISQNGDDAVELFYNGNTAADVVDIFGDIDVDGTGTAWQYNDAWAYRLDSVIAPTMTFDIAQWNVATPNCADSSVCPAAHDSAVHCTPALSPPRTDLIVVSTADHQLRFAVRRVPGLPLRGRPDAHHRGWPVHRWSCNHGGVHRREQRD